MSEDARYEIDTDWLIEKIEAVKEPEEFVAPEDLYNLGSWFPIKEVELILQNAKQAVNFEMMVESGTWVNSGLVPCIRQVILMKQLALENLQMKVNLT